jgi:hypothetical protein
VCACVCLCVCVCVCVCVRGSVTETQSEYIKSIQSATCDELNLKWDSLYCHIYYSINVISILPWMNWWVWFGWSNSRVESKRPQPEAQNNSHQFIHNSCLTFPLRHNLITEKYRIKLRVCQFVCVCVCVCLHTHKRKSTRGNNTRSVLAIFKNALLTEICLRPTSCLKRCSCQPKSEAHCYCVGASLVQTWTDIWPRRAGPSLWGY